MTFCTCILQLGIASAFFPQRCVISVRHILSPNTHVLFNNDVLFNNGRFSFFYLHNFISLIVIIYPLPKGFNLLKHNKHTT